MPPLARPATPASSSTAHSVSFLLKLFPLLGREHLLQALVRLTPNFSNPWFGFFSDCLQLRPRISNDLMHLSFLIGIELKVIDHPLKPVLPTLFIRSGPPFVNI